MRKGKENGKRNKMEKGEKKEGKGDEESLLWSYGETRGGE